MRYSSAEAILLDVVPLHEQDRIVEFLTAEQGRRRGVARGSRRKFSRFAGQLQPLAKVGITWHEKEGRDLVRIDSVELVRSADRLQAELEGILLGSYLAEHLMVFAQEHEPGDLYYRLLDSSLEALLAGVDRDLVARYFECWMLRLAGVFPAPLRCPLCGASIPERGAGLAVGEGALVCRGCLGEGPGYRSLSSRALEFLLAIGRSRPAGLAEIPPSAETLQEIEGVAARVRRAFLQHELKSYDVMRRTLEALGPPAVPSPEGRR